MDAPPQFQDTQNRSATDFGVKSAALLTTRFKSLVHFKKVVSVSYDTVDCNLDTNCYSAVHLSYLSNGERISRTMTSGINQGDLIRIQSEGYGNKLKFLIANPYAMRERKALEMAYILSRRRADIFGSKDVAFYDLAETSLRHINTPQLAFLSVQDSLEKGYLNTFNHITAQALITSFFSEELADLIGELHERYYMPQLTTGKFSEAQLKDTINNPVDNYVDIINNEIGQKIGNALKKKYQIRANTICTPELLAAYLNDVQCYYSWALGIGMDHFRATDAVITKLSKKINALLKEQ